MENSATADVAAAGPGRSIADPSGAVYCARACIGPWPTAALCVPVREQYCFTAVAVGKTLGMAISHEVEGDFCGLRRR